MKRAQKVYGEVLRLVRKLPKDSRPYYTKYARENFVNYREVEANDPKALLMRIYYREVNYREVLSLRSFYLGSQKVFGGSICC